jgi:hypothetical protein
LARLTLLSGAPFRLLPAFLPLLPGLPGTVSPSRQALLHGFQALSQLARPVDGIFQFTLGALPETGPRRLNLPREFLEIPLDEVLASFDGVVVASLEQLVVGLDAFGKPLVPDQSCRIAQPGAGFLLSLAGLSGEVLQLLPQALEAVGHT